MAMLLLLVICLFHDHAVYADSTPPPVLTIPSLGQVQGSFSTSAGGRQFTSFRGIPFAKPPVVDLRFKDPVAAGAWTGVLDATKEGPCCVQHDSLSGRVTGVEDCLMLNVYTHDVKPENGLKPVMVWIHGGGFMQGCGNGETYLYGPGYILDRDVVLVTINYRLTAFGFLTTGDAEAPGNYGLLDQALALKWVQDHIRHFGGDPESVTIFGESAGGASVESQIWSPYSKGLFHRAIAQSGATMCPWSTQQSDVESYSKLLAQDMNCPESSSEMVACLRQKNATNIVSFIQRRGQVLNSFPISMFGPRIDVERSQPFLPAEPEILVQQGNFNSVPIIAGLTQNEGAYLVAGIVAHGGEPMKEFTKDPLKYLPYMLDFELRKDREGIAKKVMAQYFDSGRELGSQLTEMEQMFSDYFFNQCVDDSVHLLSKYSEKPVYYYNYAHKGQYSLDTLIGAPPDFDQGVGHASELFVLFTMPNIFPPLSSPADIEVSSMLIDLWTSFATNGTPTSKLLKEEWLPMDRKGRTRYLKIVAEQPKMVDKPMPFHHRLPFWDNVFQQKSTKEEL